MMHEDWNAPDLSQPSSLKDVENVTTSPLPFECQCSSWAMVIKAGETLPRIHHKNCIKYSTEKIPVLMYYEEAEDAWLEAPKMVEDLFDLSVGDDCQINFKKIEVTDEEYCNWPVS